MSDWTDRWGCWLILGFLALFWVGAAFFVMWLD